MIELRDHAGYTGAFTRQQAEGAIPNGTRIRKVQGEPGDSHRLGSTGVVLGSITFRSQICYFVEWMTTPSTRSQSWAGRSGYE